MAWRVESCWWFGGMGVTEAVCGLGWRGFSKSSGRWGVVRGRSYGEFGKKGGAHRAPYGELGRCSQSTLRGIGEVLTEHPAGNWGGAHRAPYGELGREVIRLRRFDMSSKLGVELTSPQAQFGEYWPRWTY